MRISEIRIQNYRTIANLSLKFPQYYTAICGRNDAGKSNIIRLLRIAFQHQDRYGFFREPNLTVKDDFTKWREKDAAPTERFIQVDFVLEINRTDDEGLHLFLCTFLSLDDHLKGADKLSITISLRKQGDEKAEQVGLAIDGVAYEVLKAQEVYKRIQSSYAVLFHDSTEFFHPFRFQQTTGLFRELSSADESKLKEAQASVGKVLTKITKRNQQDLTEMIGRLSEKYQVGLSIPNVVPTEVPYSITLGTQDGEVELENWGSGTQNRTRILMTLFKASRIRETSTSPEKAIPVIVIEEPESYLHPSAQAEFGRTLRDLAEEFRIQVIVTTHSPYLLSLSEPSANILLERTIEKKRARETTVVDTSGDKWVSPFSLALGLSGSELGPWRDVLFSAQDTILLVEGEIDKSYLEALKNPAHGSNRLDFNGIIFPYGGKDTLRQKHLLRFIMSRSKRFIVTYDLDAEVEVEPHLKDLGLVKGQEYISIGKNQEGKRCIEGLLPDRILKSIYSSNVSLIQKLSSSISQESRSAKSALKQLSLAEFQREARPNTDDYNEFYRLATALNKLLRKAPSA